MKSFAVSLLMVAIALTLPQATQAQEVAQAMPGMEMKKEGGEMKSGATKMAGMCCCCSKKDDIAKQTEATAKPTR